MPLIIATRGSRLALWQAEHVRSLLAGLGHKSELLILKTRGDIILDVPLAKVGGKGLFVKEIEEALLDGRADIAVHSMKDVPMQLPAGLILGAIPPRENPYDLLLSDRYPSLDALPENARIGTSSLRRQAQFLAIKPDAKILSLRGNVDTRLKKLEQGEFDAIIMAAAGMNRLGLSTKYMFPLSGPNFLPAAGQGALGVELREDRQDLLAIIKNFDHLPTRLAVTAERAFMTTLEGGCQTPIAAHARITGENDLTLQDGCLVLEGLVADVSGAKILRKKMDLKLSDGTGAASELGHTLACKILEAGGREILAEACQSYL